MYVMEFDHWYMNTFMIISQNHDALNKLLQTEFKTIDITPEQFLLLWIIRDYPPPVTLTLLSRMTFRAKPTVLGVLERMDRAGLIKKARKNHRREDAVAEITTEGIRVCGQALLIMKVLHRQLIPTLSDNEHKALQSILRKMLEASLKLQRQELQQPPGVSAGDHLPLKF